MRENWSRAPEIPLTPAQAEAFLHQALPHAGVREVDAVSGGLANTNLRLELDAAPWRVLLRLYRRDPAQAGKEAAIDARLSGAVPTACFLHSGTSPAPFAVLRWIEGERLELAARRLDDEALAGLGRRIGAALAAVHAVRFDTPGFLDAALRVAQPIDLGRAGLLGFFQHCLRDREGAARLGPELTRGLFALAEHKGALLDACNARPCLVHADFNGSNILVRADAEGNWGVAAVLDWEFAFAGAPEFDLANLLRPPLGQRRGFAEAVAQGYQAAGGILAPGWQDRAALADLYSWVDFLARPAPGEALIGDARRIIAATIQRFADRSS